MKTHRNAEVVIRYLGNQPEPVTAAKVVLAGLMNLRDTAAAIRYGVLYGAIERVRVRGVSAAERTRYRLTDLPLPSPKGSMIAPSFDGLLEAWGIARVPPQQPGWASARVVLID
ncbi:hypothetical protein [Paraburkholderia sp. RL17-337-BIB-A]|jgi:hypothetical protein|uniref:hypothetical protein n=1 Tax=Paraburkholderia sp. RL17-337-BIB-A TaxID=3031636 RepID=UPI0038BD06C5